MTAYNSVIQSLNENPNKSNSKCNAPWDRRMQPQSWE